MMRDRVIVERYAEGYMAFARQTMNDVKIIEEMANFRGLLRENPDFEYFLKASEVTIHEKQEVFLKVLGADYSAEFLNFLRLLLEKGRIKKIADIAEYIRSVYAHAQETDALLRTTYPMDLDLLKTVKERLEMAMKKKFNLYLELDPDLLGGVQLVVGNTIIDGSTRKRLSEIKQKLLNINVV